MLIMRRWAVCVDGEGGGPMCGRPCELTKQPTHVQECEAALRGGGGFCSRVGLDNSCPTAPSVLRSYAVKHLKELKSVLR